MKEKELSNVTLTITSVERNEKRDISVSDSGCFDTFMEWGEYCVEVLADGYQNYETTIMLDDTNATYLSIRLYSEGYMPSGYYAEKFLDEKIIPKCETEPEDITLTYYSQKYSTTTYEELYNVENLNNWLLAYHIEDYNADGIKDLFTVTLEPVDFADDYTGITGKDNVRNLHVHRRIYFIDENGNGVLHCSHNSGVYPAYGTMKRSFVFQNDVLVEIASYDKSDMKVGTGTDSVDYPVTNNVKSHSTTINVRKYNPATKDMDFDLRLERSMSTEGKITCSVDFDSIYYSDNVQRGYYTSEEEALTEFQRCLAEYGVNGIVIPISTSWEERWNTDFFVSEDAGCTEFSLITEPTVSRLCPEAGALVDFNVEGAKLLYTTTGEMTFRWEVKSHGTGGLQ